jgi:uncharacterized protein YjbI with pentapeptide repeats
MTNLAYTNLREANMLGAVLTGTNIYCTDLYGANLKYAILINANLYGTNLIKAKLYKTQLPPPSMVLLAYWGELSDETTLALMRLDASAHPEGEKIFNKWADGDGCPYENCQIGRVANFTEQVRLWSPGPPPTLWEAMCMVLDEKCPGWNKY